MGARAHAELIADRGNAARSDDLFRCAAFLDAEAVTHTLRLTSPGRLASVPLIVRSIEGSDRADAISPYGYPGASIEGEGPAPRASDVDWSATGLISIFARERLLAEPWLASARERSRVLVHEPQTPRSIRPRLGEQVRANERQGWSVEAIPGPATGTADRDRFASAYEQTMRRAGAAERYFFDRGYFDAVLSCEQSWLLTARREGELEAGAIAGVSDSLLHYYLGGTGDAALETSPFKNVVAAMLDLADRLELALNLGGGVSAGDGLERFKRGFANAELPFLAHEVVCDAEEYRRLGGPDRADFFPAYRAPRAGEEGSRPG